MKQLIVPVPGESDIIIDVSRCIIECDNRFCKRSSDVIAGSAPLETETIKHADGVTRFRNRHSATCPYCDSLIQYRLVLSSGGGYNALAEVSENIIRFEALASDGEIYYVRNDDDLTDDPNFNFTDNINHNRPAYFYNKEADGEDIVVLDAYFIKEGESCVITLPKSAHQESECITVNGPLAILKKSIILTSNNNFVLCKKVMDQAKEALLSPNNGGVSYSDKIVICKRNSPPWTRELQENEWDENA